MIKLQDISCSFDGKNVLQNISHSIENHATLLGANGSGKSTLAKIICGLIQTQGKVFFDTKNISEFSLLERAKRISYIPAKLEIYDTHISVEEFVLLGRFPYKKSYFDYTDKDKKIVSQTLDFLKIAHLKSHKTSALSSGEQSLTLIAQALAQQSSVMLFDEPTANLDPQNTKVIAQHIKGLKKYHKVILITHDLHLASFIDSEILFIKDSHLLSFKNDFFDDENLEKLYDVRFKNLVAQYD